MIFSKIDFYLSHFSLRLSFFLYKNKKKHQLIWFSSRWMNGNHVNVDDFFAYSADSPSFLAHIDIHTESKRQCDGGSGWSKEWETSRWRKKRKETQQKEEKEKKKKKKKRKRTRSSSWSLKLINHPSVSRCTAKQRYQVKIIDIGREISHWFNKRKSRVPTNQRPFDRCERWTSKKEVENKWFDINKC